MEVGSPPTATQPFWVMTPLTEAASPLPNGAAMSTPVWPAHMYWVMTPFTGHARYPPDLAAGAETAGRAMTLAATSGGGGRARRAALSTQIRRPRAECAGPNGQ